MTSHVPSLARLICALVFLAAALAAPGPARAEGLQSLREEVRQTADLAQTLAGLIDLTMVPDISAASFTVEDRGASESQLTTNKLPFYHEFKNAGKKWRPFVGVILARLSATASEKQTLNLDQGGSGVFQANSRYTGLSGLLEAGVRLPLGSGFWFSPSAGLGAIRLMNQTDFLNDFSRRVIKPLLDGIIANFTLDAYLYALSAAFSWRGEAGPLSLLLKAKYTSTWVETYRSSDQAQRINRENRLAVFLAQVTGPAGVRLFGQSVKWQVFVSQANLLDQNQDELGFSRYHEIGGALGLDLSDRGWWAEAIKLGGSAIFGDGVEGWSLILGFAF